MVAHYISVIVIQTRHPPTSTPMLNTYDINKFIKTLTTYNQSLKSALNLSTVLNQTNLNVTSDPFNEQKIDQLFQRASHPKTATHLHDRPEPKDYVQNIQFFREFHAASDRLISGLPASIYNKPDPNPQQFNQCPATGHDLTKNFKQSYLVGKIIGQGAYASVRLALHKPTQKRVAIKVYEKGKLQKVERKKSVQRQIRILSFMNHKNILKIYDVVETNNHLNIVMEYLSGISLSEYVKKKQGRKLSEREAKSVLRGLAQALFHMKTHNISHRDIKVENVILDESLNPKLIDFGFSTCIEQGKKIQIFCGTPNYMAPEIVMRKQFCGMKADIWALGVLFFIVTTGVYPFKGSTDQQLYHRIINLQYPKYLLNDNLKQVPDLIERMLRFNPDERITPEEILIHPWLAENNRTSLSKNGHLISPLKRQRVSTSISNYKQNKPLPKNRVSIKSPLEIRKDFQNNVRLKQFLNSTLKPRNCERVSQKKSQPKHSSKSKPKKVAKEEPVSKSSHKLKSSQLNKLQRSKSKIRLT